MFWAVALIPCILRSIMEVILPAAPPFSFSAVVGSHGWAQLAPFGVSPDGGLTYVYRMDSGRVVELRIREASGGIETAVDGALDPREQRQVARDAAWMFGLEQDLSPFYALARAEPKLAKAEARAQGRVLRCPTLFEDTVKTMLTVNTSWAGTIRMVAALVDQFGDPLPGDPTRRAFPTPERLAATDEETLRSRTRLGFRAPSVLQLARSVASSSLDLESLKAAAIPTVELQQSLLAIRGIGPYAAANLLMILGRYHFIPVDSWALKLVSQEWHSGQPVTPADVEAAFERWGEWKGLAYWFWDWSESSG
jgi:3-methyladenine DNA glycosylase/8-oxoguanine DNA glycosylase